MAIENTVSIDFDPRSSIGRFRLSPIRRDNGISRYQAHIMSVISYNKMWGINVSLKNNGANKKKKQLGTIYYTEGL